MRDVKQHKTDSIVGFAKGNALTMRDVKRDNGRWIDRIELKCFNYAGCKETSFFFPPTMIYRKCFNYAGCKDLNNRIIYKQYAIEML